MSQAQAMPDHERPTLGDLIAEYRDKRRMSQRTLAARANVSLSSVKNWEADRVTPSGTHLVALEHALGVRFVDDGAGHYAALDAAPDAPPDTPRVVVVVASTAEAVNAVFDRLGIPREG